MKRLSRLHRFSGGERFAQKVDWNVVCERPPAASRPSPFVRGTVSLSESTRLFSPLQRGSAAEGGEGVAHTSKSDFLCKAGGERSGSLAQYPYQSRVKVAECP